MTENGDDFVNFNNLSVPEGLINAILYPNPTSGKLTIVAEEIVSVSIYDLVGQCLMQVVASDGQAVLDMSPLQNGIYLIKVNTTNGSGMQRVVKQ